MSRFSLSTTGLDLLSAQMNSFVTRGSVAGVVMLVSQGDTVWTHAHGYQDIKQQTPMTSDTIFRIASMTKPIFATAAMMLVEEGLLDLDAPVDRWLPELANRQVVRSITGPLDDTVPAERPITLRQILTLTWGLGAMMLGDGSSPLAEAVKEAGLSPKAFPPELSPDAWMAALGALPLAHQPGEGWLYHTGYDVLAVLLARVSGQPLATLLQDRIFTPLGMVDTGFFTPAASIDRLATTYETGTDGLVVLDPAVGGAWSKPPAFPSELTSTTGDYLAFSQMLMAKGDAPTGRLLTTASVDEMTTDHISSRIKIDYPFFPGFWDRSGWGYGVSMRTSGERDLGAYGWSGGFHTHWQNDPTNDLIGMLFVQQAMGGPDDSAMVNDFWRLTYDSLVS